MGSVMKKVLFVALVSLLFGCGTPRLVAPGAVLAMPNDCANRQAILNWLSSQAAIPRQPFESEKEYEHNRSQIRSKIWITRYNCQPV
jgi:hypothetical protein